MSGFSLQQFPSIRATAWPCALLLALATAERCALRAEDGPFSFHASASDTKEVGDLILRFPAPIKEVGRNVSPEPEHPVKQVVRYKGNVGSLEVSVNSVEFNPAVAVDLSGAAAGSVKSVSALPGITDPKSAINDTTISGHAAKTVSFSATRNGRVLCVESLYIRKGQQMLTVMVTFPGAEEGLKAKAAEIIGSVRLKGAK